MKIITSDHDRVVIQLPNKPQHLGVLLGFANIIIGLILLYAWVYVWVFWNTGPNNKGLAALFIIDIGKILLIPQVLSLAIEFYVAVKGSFSWFLKAGCIGLVILGMTPTLAFICYFKYIYIVL